MLKIRRSEERGLADHGWLNSHHTFSFASYHDPAHMGFGPLRVINEDRIKGGTGFGAHSHRDMEIISYVIDGALEHQDSMGNKTVIRAGDVQRMSAGTGVTHSEQNHLGDKATHFFQIWVIPERTGLPPTYAQKYFLEELERTGRVLVVSRDGREGSLSMHQDADMYLARLRTGTPLPFSVRPGRALWLQVVRGELSVEGATLRTGDAAAVTQEDSVTLLGSDNTEVIIFDLPAH